MGPESRLYTFNSHQWTWDQLSARLDRAERDAFVKKRGRTACALTMISGDDVLDLGCNAGILSAYLAAQGHRVVGLEINPELIEICKRRYPERPGLSFRTGGGEGLDFPDNSFDCAVVLEVLEHVRRPWDLLSDLARVLRPGGGLVLSVPNAASLRVLLKTAVINLPRRFREMNRWPEYFSDQRDHVYLWDIFTLYRLLSLKGFRYRMHGFADSNSVYNFISGIIPPLRKFSSSLILKTAIEK